MITSLRGSKTSRRVSGFRGSASGEIMGCLVVGRSFGLDVSEVAVDMSGVRAAMRGLGKEASDNPRLLCGRPLAAKATPAPRSVRESVVRLPPLAFIRRPGESLLSTMSVVSGHHPFLLMNVRYREVGASPRTSWMGAPLPSRERLSPSRERLGLAERGDILRRSVLTSRIPSRPTPWSRRVTSIPSSVDALGRTS